MTGGKAKNEDFTAGVKEDVPEEEFTKQAVRPCTGMDESRLDARRSLRERLDTALKHSEPASGVADEFRGAFDMLLSPSVRAAFDLSKESDKVRDLYGKTRIGTRCLLARRLVEAGAPFVMVDYGYDPEYGNLWDQHNAAGQNFPHVCAVTPAHTPADTAATIYQALGIDLGTVLHDREGRSIPMLPVGQPIRSVIG
jgi:hypothetical protein